MALGVRGSLWDKGSACVAWRVAQGGCEDIAGSPFWGHSILQTPSIHMPSTAQPVGARHVGAGGDQRFGTPLHVGQGLV